MKGNVPIIKTMKKFPGGMMIIPLLLGAIVNTVFPAFLNIGGFTTAMFSKTAAPTFVGIFVFCCGATINFKEIGIPFYKGSVLLVTKLAVGIAIGVLIGKAFGPAGLLTITPLAIISALANSNSIMYSILADQYGDATDAGAVGVLALDDGPFFTMIALGISGMATIPFMSLVSVIIPLIIGLILGNLDKDWRDLAEKGMELIVPFNGFALGAGMNLRDVVVAGVPGVVLGLVSLLATGLIAYVVYNWFFGRKNKTAVGAGIGNTAGNAVATPMMVAQADTSGALAPVAAVATAQVTAACVVTSILCPILVSWLDRRLRKKEAKQLGVTIEEVYRMRQEAKDARLLDEQSIVPEALESAATSD